MNKHLGLAYGLAGLAVAVAFIVVVGATTGMFGGNATGAVSEPPAPTAPAQDQPPAPALPAVDQPSDSEPAYAEGPSRTTREHQDREHEGDDGRTHHGESDDD